MIIVYYSGNQVAYSSLGVCWHVSKISAVWIILMLSIILLFIVMVSATLMHFIYIGKFFADVYSSYIIIVHACTSIYTVMLADSDYE